MTKWLDRGKSDSSLLSFLEVGNIWQVIGLCIFSSLEAIISVLKPKNDFVKRQIMFYSVMKIFIHKENIQLLSTLNRYEAFYFS